MPIQTFPNAPSVTNDPMTEDVNQEASNLVTIQAAILLLQSYIVNGTGGKPTSNKSLADLISILQTSATALQTLLNNAGTSAPTSGKSILDLIATLQASATALQTLLNNAGTSSPASGKSILDLVAAIPTTPALATTLATLITYIYNGTGATIPSNKSLVDLLNAIPTNPVLATALTSTIIGYINNANLATIPNISALMTELVAWLNNSGNALPATTSLYDALTQKTVIGTLSQASPTQNSYYNILAATANVEAIYVAVSIATTGETLQVKLIVDGQTYTSGTLACTAGTSYYVTLTGFSAAGVPTFTIQSTSATLGGSSYSFGGRSVQIQVQKTTAAGSGTLTGAVLYNVR